MFLAFAPIGVECVVTDVRCDDKVKRHLTDLGLTIGSNVKAVSDSGGDLIFMIKDVRVAMNRAVAMKIMVQPKK